MNSSLSRRVPPWLTRIGWPDRPVGMYMGVFGFLLVWALLLQRLGMNPITVVGWLTVIGAMALEVVRRLVDFRAARSNPPGVAG